MPIYEYKCLNCGSHIEKIQKTTDDPLTTCESCGGELAKQWSLSGFQFKGEGWYVTDYAGKKNGGAAAEDKSKGGESTASDKPASQGTQEKGTKPDTSGKKDKD
jgi:putative FmdB family regulatory protein